MSFVPDHLRSVVKAQKEAMAWFRMIEPSRARNMTMSMLFLKFVSDHEIKMIRMPPHARFEVLFQKRNEAHLDVLIALAFEELAKLNPKHFAGVFDEIDFRAPSGIDCGSWTRSLCALLEAFQPLKLEDPSFLSELFEYFLDPQLAKQSGSFFTPREVADLLASLLEPRVGDMVCDPTCGTGNLLVSCGHFGGKRVRLFGQELSFANWMIGKLSLALHGLGGEIQRGDTIRSPLLVDEGKLRCFDVIVGNPPFSQKNWGRDEVFEDAHHRFKHGLPHKNRGDLAFVSHMVATMKEGSGRAGVLLSYGPLTRKGVEATIRRSWVDENLVDAIIALPEKLFVGSHAVAVVIFKKERACEHVLCIDASHESKPGRKRNILTQDGTERIISVFRERKEIRGFSRLVSLKELLESLCFDARLYV